MGTRPFDWNFISLVRRFRHTKKCAGLYHNVRSTKGGYHQGEFGDFGKLGLTKRHRLRSWFMNGPVLWACLKRGVYGRARLQPCAESLWQLGIGFSLRLLRMSTVFT